MRPYINVCKLAIHRAWCVGQWEGSKGRRAKKQKVTSDRDRRWFRQKKVEVYWKITADSLLHTVRSSWLLVNQQRITNAYRKWAGQSFSVIAASEAGRSIDYRQTIWAGRRVWPFLPSFPRFPIAPCLIRSLNNIVIQHRPLANAKVSRVPQSLKPLNVLWRTWSSQATAFARSELRV